MNVVIGLVASLLAVAGAVLFASDWPVFGGLCLFLAAAGGGIIVKRRAFENSIERAVRRSRT